MYSPFQALHRRGSAGLPLPSVYQSFHNHGIIFRMSQVSLLAGIPSSGKSMLAGNLIAGWKLPTLYFAADADEFSFVKRILATLTGHPTSQIEEEIKTRRGAAFYQNKLSVLPDLRLVFKAPSIDDVESNIDAFTEAYGEPPSIVVIDNLMNMDLGADNEWMAMRDMTRLLDDVARENQTHVMVLHHTNEQPGKEYDCPAQSNIQGKIAQLPRLILTVAMNKMTGEYNVACVKNSHGPCNPTGRSFVPMVCFPDQMRIMEPQYGMNGVPR